jgi:hypothetical protein
MFRGQRPEACQIGKDGIALPAGTDLVFAPDLRMTVAIRRVGKLDGDERLAL